MNTFLHKKYSLGAILAFFFFFNNLNGQQIPPKPSGPGQAVSLEKSDPSVSLNYKDTLTIPSFTDFDLPVKMITGHEISAISLGFYFPVEYLEINGMELAGQTPGFSFSVVGGHFKMAWSDIAPLNILDGEVIMTLRMRSLDINDVTGSIMLEIDEFSEFADGSAHEIPDVVLEIPEIAFLFPDDEDSIGHNYIKVYPNPFRDLTSVNFNLIGESRVNITLFDLTGKEIRQVADAVYPKGIHQVKIYASDLSIGIFIMKFEMINDEMSGSKLIKILSY